MSNTKRQPLLSNEFMENHADKWNEGVRGITIQHRACLLQGADWAREHYEAALAKDAELIQQLVDGIIGVYWMRREASKKLMTELLATAATAGFKPSDSTN